MQRNYDILIITIVYDIKTINFTKLFIYVSIERVFS